MLILIPEDIHYFVLLLFEVDQQMNVIVHHILFVIEKFVHEDDQILH